MHRKRASGKLLSTSRTLARFRAAGAERSPLKSERPAYERSLIDPGGSRHSWKNWFMTGSSSKGPLDWNSQRTMTQCLRIALR